MSSAEMIRRRLAEAVPQSFLAASALPGSRRAVECELSRLTAAGEVVRVRKGLYWKGPKTRFGMGAPRAGDVAIEVGGLGSGPAELAAAHMLGLTTQVPSVPVIAVPGRVPKPVPGTRFVSRSIARRIGGLRPVEVAVLEVLRSGPAVVEKPWTEFVAIVSRLAAADEVRIEALAAQVAEEHHVATRERWAELAAPSVFRMSW